MQCSCHTQPPQDMWHKLGPSLTHILMLTVTHIQLYTYFFVLVFFFFLSTGAFWRSASQRECELHFYVLMVNPFFVPNASWSHQSFIGTELQWRVGGELEQCIFALIISPLYSKKGSTLRRWISLPLTFFFFFFFWTCNGWSASVVRTFSDGCFPPKPGLSYRGLSLHGSVDWASASQGRL